MQPAWPHYCARPTTWTPVVTAVWGGSHHVFAHTPLQPGYHCSPQPLMSPLINYNWLGQNDEDFINGINYAHINTFHKKGYWFKIGIKFLWPILAKIELIHHQPTMTQLSGVYTSSGVLERMAGGLWGGLAMTHELLTTLFLWTHHRTHHEIFN